MSKLLESKLGPENVICNAESVRLQDEALLSYDTTQLSPDLKSSENVILEIFYRLLLSLLWLANELCKKVMVQSQVIKIVSVDQKNRDSD